MINIVFEGAPGAGKTTIINEVVKKLKSFGIKVENTVDIDPTTPLYPILHNMNCTTPLITSNIEFSTVLYETFIQTADYFYIKERIENVSRPRLSGKVSAELTEGARVSRNEKTVSYRTVLNTCLSFLNGRKRRSGIQE